MTPDDDWARVVESAAQALADVDGDYCFKPWSDTPDQIPVRDRYREKARHVLAAVGHRMYRDDLHRVLSRVNELLREHGYEYPLGVRGVEDALTHLAGLREDVRSPDYLRAQLAHIETTGEA